MDGMTELQIPSGTQPGDVLVLAKRGVPKLNKPSIRGDHLFTIKVTIPSRIRYIFHLMVLFYYRGSLFIVLLLFIIFFMLNIIFGLSLCSDQLSIGINASIMV